MAITKERKDGLLAQYDEAVRKSRALIITEYRGLNTPDLGRLRGAIRDANGAYNVVKLTLFKLALERAGLPIPEDLLTGPVAVGFCYQEVPAVAKAFKEYAKGQELLTVKGGIMGNRLLTSKDVEALADLPPLEVVRAQLMGVLNGPARNLASVVASGVRQVINVLNAYAEKDTEAAEA